MFALASKAAALISPADRKYIDPAEGYGRELGKAFQIVDDVLDFTGNQTRVGKPIGNDLRQGVPTLPALYYGDKFPEDTVLKETLNGTADDSAVEDLIQRINNSGVIQLAMDEAIACTEKAISYLKDFPGGKDRESLKELANYIVDRDL